MPGLTVVGVPARDEASTVGAVAVAADAGLAREPGDGIIVLAENGSVDGTVDAFKAVPLEHHREVLSAVGVGTGKGTNVLALIHRAVELDADQLVLLDGDLRSAAPWWVDALARAVDHPQPAMATPVYRRDRFEAGTTAHLATPLLCGMLGATVQQPIGGEFALNRPLLREVLTWPAPASVEHYGIDIWLVAGALARHYRVSEVELGTKLHSTPFASVLQLPRQVLDALLRTVLHAGVPAAQEARIVRAPRSSVRDDPGVPQPQADVDRVLDVVRRYSAQNAGDIARTLPSLGFAQPAPWGYRIESRLWPYVLADAADAIATGDYDTARDHLVVAFIQRLVTFWDETRTLNAGELDELLAEQIAATVEQLAPRRPALRATSTPPEAFIATGPWSLSVPDEPDVRAT